jgi:hypothetical protein
VGDRRPLPIGIVWALWFTTLALLVMAGILYLVRVYKYLHLVKAEINHPAMVRKPVVLRLGLTSFAI